MYEISVEVSFDSAHRLFDYIGKCNSGHGHSYYAIVGFSSAKLIGAGFVIDFGIVKEFLKGWINSSWDHAMLLTDKDPLKDITELGHTYIMPEGLEPTAENMCKVLFDVMKNAFADDRVRVDFVSIKETATTIATYRENK